MNTNRKRRSRICSYKMRFLWWSLGVVNLLHSNLWNMLCCYYTKILFTNAAISNKRAKLQKYQQSRFSVGPVTVEKKSSLSCFDVKSDLQTEPFIWFFYICRVYFHASKADCYHFLICNYIRNTYTKMPRNCRDSTLTVQSSSSG